MARLEHLVGSLTAAYTSTQYDAGSTPRVGDWFYDTTTKSKYIFLKNTGSASIAASDVATSTTTQRDTYLCQQAAGGTNNQAFAGARRSDATSLAQNEYGWFQISGKATLTADAAGTTADSGVVTSNATAGAVEAQSSTYAIAMCPATVFGIARTTTTAGAVVVDIVGNVWGL